MKWFNNFFQQIFRSPAEVNTDPTPPEHSEPLSEEYLLSLEEQLLRLDCGLEFTEYVLDCLRRNSQLQSVQQAQQEVERLCVQAVQSASATRLDLQSPGLKIIFVSGVNGSGKTTSLGKLAYRLRQSEQKVLIAPCDTFRAAAQEQLQRWAQRAGANLYIPPEATPGRAPRADSVLYGAIAQAQEQNVQVLLVDTAGRLQNKRELMDELARLSRVIDKHAPPDAQVERWLVIDSTTGQNGYQQAVSFNEIAPLTGLILSKFDGSAKGGIVFAIGHNLALPIRYLGVGEGLEDFLEFDAREFVQQFRAGA